MTQPWTGPGHVLRIRIDRVVMDADLTPGPGHPASHRAALLTELQDAVHRHLLPSGDPDAGSGGLDSAGQAVARAVQEMVVSRNTRATRPGRPGAS